MTKGHWVIALLGYSVIGLLGCAALTEGAKGFAGISTKILEDTRKDAIAKNFNYDYNTCYNNTQEILKRIGAYIYAKAPEKNMLAIYVSGEDTTPVGLFFKEIDKTHTRIEVSSASTYAREFISQNVFSVLDKSVSIEELEAQINAKRKKEMADKETD